MSVRAREGLELVLAPAVVLDVAGAEGAAPSGSGGSFDGEERGERVMGMVECMRGEEDGGAYELARRSEGGVDALSPPRERACPALMVAGEEGEEDVSEWTVDIGLRMRRVAAESLDLVDWSGGAGGSVCAPPRPSTFDGVVGCGPAERRFSSMGDAGTGELVTGVVVIERDGLAVRLTSELVRVVRAFSGEEVGDPCPNAHDMRYGFCDSCSDGSDGSEGIDPPAPMNSDPGPPPLMTGPPSAGDPVGESSTTPPSDSGPAPSPERRASSAAAAAADLLSLRPNRPPSVALRVLRLGVGSGGTLPARSSARSLPLPLPDDDDADGDRSSAERRRPLVALSALIRARSSRSRSLERRAAVERTGAGAKSQCGWLGTGSGRTIVLALADAWALEAEE